MPLVIDDKTLREAGLTEQQAKLEFACTMFAAGRISFQAACAIAGIDRIDMHQELGRRGIDSFHYTSEDLRRDVETLNQVLGKQ